MDRLPIDLVNVILSYDGTIKQRAGKYMNQIPKSDVRYELLSQIPQKHLLFANNKHYATYTCVIFSTGKFSLYMTEHPYVNVYRVYKNGRPLEDATYVLRYDYTNEPLK